MIVFGMFLCLLSGAFIGVSFKAFTDCSAGVMCLISGVATFILSRIFDCLL